MQNKYLDGVSVEIDTFDLECKGSTYKLDLLYYNSINRYGEVLTSLVYNSGVKSAGDTTKTHYEPNKLFNNTAFERSYSLAETNYRWKNADLKYGYKTVLKDNSYSATHSFKHFNILTDYAVEYNNGEYAYDGWYSLVSVGLEDIADDVPTALGKMRYKPDTGYPEYADNTDGSSWVSLTEIDDSNIPIYNFTNFNDNGVFTSEDFVVTVKTYTLYKKLLNRELNTEWFSYVNTIGPKLRTLESAIEHQAFDVSQHVINSINCSLTTLLI